MPWRALLGVAAVLLSANVLLVAGKRILVTGGLMKSHHLAVVPVIEGLLQRGHDVTFVLPGTDEAKEWFPDGVGNARLVYLGPSDADFGSVKIPDMKNLAWYQQIGAWAELIWNYRSMIDKPIFGIVDDFSAFLKENEFDVAFSSVASIGCNAVVQRAGIPWVSFFSAPAGPGFFISDEEVLCRYPNMLKPRSLKDLKSSLALRVLNRIQCILLSTYTKFGLREINAVLRGRGLAQKKNFQEILLPAPVNVVLGGPPLSLPFRMPETMHLVGTVELSEARAMNDELLQWLDAAAVASAPVLYVSMGTKYELSRVACSSLVGLLEQAISKLGLRVLWSLRASQQELLRDVLPSQGEKLRIEKFTPQPEVLKHRSVKVFLSHCGWGGITDTLAAGVPTLTYPSFSEQHMNAMLLVEVGAGLHMEPDFSNLVEATAQLLQEPAFASAAKGAAAALRSLGGLNRTLELVEAASERVYLPPLPAARSAMSKADPFLLRQQDAEKVFSMMVACFSFFFGLCIFTCCCKACFWCCCCLWLYPDEPKPRKKRAKGTGEAGKEKKQQ